MVLFSFVHLCHCCFVVPRSRPPVGTVRTDGIGRESTTKKGNKRKNDKSRNDDNDDDDNDQHHDDHDEKMLGISANNNNNNDDDDGQNWFGRENPRMREGRDEIGEKNGEH